MSTATTTSHDTGQTKSRRTTTQPTNTPTTQLERSAANRLRTTMAAVRLAFTWLGVRKTLAPEQRGTAARAFHADRELLSASQLILDTKNPAYRAVAAVRSEASGYWRTVTLPFPEAGIRLLPQASLGQFASTMETYRERLQEAARELSGHYDTIKSEAERRLGEFRTVLAGLRQECPPALPVVVRASWLPETILGQCLRRDKRFVVLLNDKMGEPRAVEVLCHEWAHAVAWDCAYSRVWRAYLDVIREAA